MFVQGLNTEEKSNEIDQWKGLCLWDQISILCEKYKNKPD